MVATAGARVLTTVSCGVLGLVVGSFLNVVVHRLPRRLSVVAPRSRCPTCQTPLRALDNVPVLSWVLLGGRCRTCRATIGIRYPAVELATAGAFVALAWALGPSAPLPSLLLVATAMITGRAIEADGFAEPPAISLAAALGAASLLLIWPPPGGAGRLAWAAAGAVAGAIATAPARRGPDAVRGSGAGAVLRIAGAMAPCWVAGWLWAPAGLALAGWMLAVRSVWWWRASTGGRRWVPALGTGLGALGLLVAAAAMLGP